MEKVWAKKKIKRQSLKILWLALMSEDGEEEKENFLFQRELSKLESYGTLVWYRTLISQSAAAAAASDEKSKSITPPIFEKKWPTTKNLREATPTPTTATTATPAATAATATTVAAAAKFKEANQTVVLFRIFLQIVGQLWMIRRDGKKTEAHKKTFFNPVQEKKNDQGSTSARSFTVLIYGASKWNNFCTSTKYRWLGAIGQARAAF